MLDSLLDSPVLVAIITIGTSIITGGATWLLGRRRSDTEIAEISARVYNSLITDLEARVERQSKTITEQDEKICKQHEQYERVIVYVEKLEDLLIASNVIKRTDLESIKAELGI